MAKLFVVSMLVALSHAAPGNYAAGHLGYAAAPGHLGYATGPAVVAERTHLGPAVATTHHEVVGSRTVQVGTKAIQTGHTYVHAGTQVAQAPAYSYQAGPPRTSVSNHPIAPPQIPIVTPNLAVPGPYTNQGPAPADTVTTQIIQAPVRAHTRITPQVKRIEPELQIVQKPYDVPVAVPRPVERIVTVDRHVAKPYAVEVPRPVPVAQPYKVHPVQHVVETPVIDRHHVTVHQPRVAVHTQAVATGHVAYAAAPVAAGHVGYAAAPVAAAGHVAYAAPAAAVHTY